MHSLRSQVRLPALLMAVMFPILLIGGTDIPESVEKVKQFHKAQNRSTMLEAIKSQSIDVHKKMMDTRGVDLRQSLDRRQNQKRVNPVSDASPGIHRLQATVSQPVEKTLLKFIEPVQYGSGTLANTAGMEYFNFLSGMNSGDSSGMDVRHTTNEAGNFGNEYANYLDPSLLYFLSPSGTLEDVTEVAAIDDPDTVWTDVSWDWSGGNSGMPMQVGNLWVVYARTSHMYVVMEITAYDAGTYSFSFDYKIQTNGSTLFGDSGSSAKGLDIIVNGREADTLLIGSEPAFSIFLAGETGGKLIISWDQNHNGLTDVTDIPVQEFDFIDNDIHDMNPADSVFDFIYNQDMAEGLNYITDDFVFSVYAGDGMADAALTYYANPSAFTVEGTIRDSLTQEPLEGIVVWGDIMYYDMGPMPEEHEGPTVIAITDDLGKYTLTFPDSGFVMLGSWDHLMVTEGLLPEPGHVEFSLVSAVTGIDWFYRQALAWIDGYVLDNEGQPVVDAQVRAEPNDENDDGGDFYGYTDESGYYHIGVDPGNFWVELDGEALIPDYLVQDGGDILVTQSGPNQHDFMLYVPNSTISGSVQLDGAPYPNAIVMAWNEAYGWNAVWSDGFGDYVLPVYEYVSLALEGISPTGYQLMVYFEDQMMGNQIVQVSDNSNVEPGTTGELIELQTLTGGLSGVFVNAENGEPILDSWDVGMMARDLNTWMEFYTNPSPEDGSYQLYMPDGTYEILAGGMNWNGPEPDTVTIAGVLIENYDIVMTPVQYNGVFEGKVMDNVTGAPLAGASVDIGNEYWGNYTETGADGRFHFDLPNGNYGYRVYAPGYFDYFGGLDINNDYVFHEIRLDEFVIDGAIEGYVSEGSSVPAVLGVGGSAVSDANVHVWNSTFNLGFNTMTDAEGAYWFDLPNGMYDIYVDHPDYLPYWDDSLRVTNDTLTYNVYLTTADGFISGRVFDGDDLYPIMHAFVWVMSMEGSPTYDFGTTVDDSGRFHIPVPNGTFEVHVDANGYEHNMISNVVVSDNEVSLEIPMMKMVYRGPAIHFVTDQPHDQGRWVRLQFGPSGMDLNEFSAFSIWRTSNTPLGMMLDFIAYVPNRGDPVYNYVAPTLIDSNAYTTPEMYMTEFMVTGHYDDWNWMDGGPAAGYSKDNIFPGVPEGLLLAGTGDGYNELQWAPSPDKDFQFYELYRSDTENLSDFNLINRLVEDSYRDEDVVTGEDYYYMLKAVDANGNVSKGSTVMVAVVGVADAGLLPSEYRLAQNYPNPFNPSTAIGFDLPQHATVSLDIYNIRGQKIRSLISDDLSAGRYQIEWDGTNQQGTLVSSGTYIYQLKADEKRFTKKMLYMK